MSAMQVPRSVQLAGLVAVALADVALVVAIMRSPDGLAADPPAKSGATTTATTATTATTTATASPTSAAAKSPVRAMAVVGAKVAYRAAPAGCSVTAPGLEKTTDGGRTWKPVSVPARSVVRIEFTSASEGYVVGTGNGCDLQVWRTSTGGTDWGDPTPAGEFWSALPSSTTQVNSAGGVRTPCPAGSTVAQVARVTDADTYVLCSKGEVRRTTNGGAAWSTATTVAGARTVTVDRSQGTRLVLAGNDKDCPGTRIWLLPAGARTAESWACIPGAKQATPLALDAGGDAVWLSRDSGTWLAAVTDLTRWSEG